MTLLLFFMNDALIVGGRRHIPRTKISQRILDGEGMVEGEDLKDAASDFRTEVRNTGYSDDCPPYVSYDDIVDDSLA